jgi:hypothetical protein
MVILENHTKMVTLSPSGLQYNQGFVHLNHILNIFFILSPILTHLPSLVQRRDLSFYLHLLRSTRCLACLIPLYDLLIVNGRGSAELKKKYQILLVND